MFKAIAATCGVVVLVVVWLSVLRTTLIPGRSSSRLARWTVWACAMAAGAIAALLPSRARVRVLEFTSPLALFLLAAGWLIGLTLGFVLLAVSVSGAALELNAATGALGVVATMSALLVLSMFGAYLVQVVGAYRRREQMMTRSANRVNVVTDAELLLADHLRVGSQTSLDNCFAQWATWLADIHDSHTSYPGLVYHRSVGEVCWAKRAMIIMDAAAIVRAIAPNWAPVHAKVVLDVGSVCLQDLATQIGIRLPVMSVSLHGREERAFSETAQFAADSGLPIERDIDGARSAFQEIRVQYAPYAVLIDSRLSRP